jgi:hypothetical protein
MAGFEVTLYGRFWVTPEAYTAKSTLFCQSIRRSRRDSLSKSKRPGAWLCNVLRGHDVINDYEMLAAAAGKLGILVDTLDRALGELQEIGYVTLTFSARSSHHYKQRDDAQ